MSRVATYIDGLNLYHGMREEHGRSLHWLDVEVLCTLLLRPGQRLAAVHYFTTRVRDQSGGRLRQVTYLDALQAHCRRLTIHEGRFQEKWCFCHYCRASWLSYEEKESDVNMATSLVADAAQDRYDTALLISGDSDLCPAIRAVRRIRPGTRVVAIFPPRRYSHELKITADAAYFIPRSKFLQAQLPRAVVTAAGAKLSRPAYWC